DREWLILGRRERQGLPRGRRLCRAQRNAADVQGQRDDQQQPHLAPAGPGSDAAEDNRRERRAGGCGGVRHRCARSRRMRALPTCSSSPKPSGAVPSTGLPLTNVPLVLPRSSTYHARPRNVSTQCSDDTNWSSTTTLLFTSRPIVVTASSAKTLPTGGSSEGDATTTRRPSWVDGSRAATRRSRRRICTTEKRNRYRRARKANRMNHSERISGSIACQASDRDSQTY